MKKKNKEQEISHIVRSLKRLITKQMGNNYTLILHSDGSGNLAVPAPDTDSAEIDNYLFNDLDTLLCQPKRLH